MMFDEHFPPSCAGTVERWVPTWSKQSDPSGRYVDVKVIVSRLAADYRVSPQSHFHPQRQIRQHRIDVL